MKNNRLLVLLFMLLLFFFGDLSKLYAISSPLPIKFFSTDFKQTELLFSYQKKANKAYKDSISLIGVLRDIESNLRSKGCLTACYDSVRTMSDCIAVYWSVGDRYTFASLKVKANDSTLLADLGFHLSKNDFTANYYSRMMSSLLKWGCSNGYPFSLVKLEDVQLGNNADGIKGNLVFEKGNSYHLDSVVVKKLAKGNLKLNNRYFLNYLDLQEGELYNENKIIKWNSKLKELPFVEEVRPFDLEYSDSTFHPVFYLQNKKASMLNGVVGFQSDNTNSKKVYLTGDVKIKLLNAFGRAELIDFNWNNPQPRTQDLKIKFNYPFIFNLPFGIEAEFSLFKKDTLWFEVNRQLGIQYLFSGNNSIKIFAGKKTNNLISVSAYQNQSKLPDVADMQLLNYGLGFQWQNLDYRFNPRTGYDINITATAGQRSIKRNIKFPEVWYDSLNLKTNQYRMDANADCYYPIGKLSVLNIGVSTSYLQGENYFSNELIRFGGLKSLRGFNETSFSASSLVIGKLEYRVLLEQNSFLFLFFNQAYYEDLSKSPSYNDHPYGLGAGLNFETKAGIFSFTYAVGSLQDKALQFKDAKIHFGLVNLF